MSQGSFILKFGLSTGNKTTRRHFLAGILIKLRGPVATFNTNKAIEVDKDALWV